MPPCLLATSICLCWAQASFSLAQLILFTVKWGRGIMESQEAGLRPQLQSRAEGAFEQNSRAC